MLKQRAKLVAFSLFLVDEAVTLLSFVLAYWLRASVLAPAVGGRLYPFGSYTFLLLAIVPAWALCFWFLGLYQSQRTSLITHEVWKIFQAVIYGALMLALFIFLTRTGPYVSRILLVLFLLINFLALAIERIAVRSLSRAVRRRGYNFRNILVVGTDERARDFDETIRHHIHWGIVNRGFIEPDGTESRVEPERIIGRIDDLPRLLQETVVDEVIFVVPPSQLSFLEDTFLLCEELGIRTRVVMEYLPKQLARVYVEMVEGIPVLTFSTAPVDITALFIKRAADLILAGLLLLATLPVMLLIALVVKVSSPGTVLFRQVRVGLNGRRFTLLKFRSMYRDAERRKAELAHLNVMDGPVFKVRNDPRVTPVGRVLRTTSLDELPQLINVLKGDMSFVGPRPPVPEEVSRYQRWQRRRLSMKPGITGLWQVSGRNNVDFNTWMKMDLDYIDRWSLWLDMKIILKTIPTVLSRRGAM